MFTCVKRISDMFTEIYMNKSLLVSLSSTDFRRKYAGSYLGIVWGFLQPFLTILLYCFVFQFGFRSGNIGEIPFVLWFICGIVPWLFISEALMISSYSFIEYSYLVKKVVFNINILPLIKIISSFYIHLFFLVITIVIACIFGFFPTIYYFQLFYYIFCSILIILAISLIFSTVIVFFRDLGQVINILLLFGLWCTPIAWNASQFSKNIQFILKLNPFYYIVEGYRDSILGGTWFWQKYMLTLYFWMITVVLMVFGSWMFERLKPHFADIL